MNVVDFFSFLSVKKRFIWTVYKWYWTPVLREIPILNLLKFDLGKSMGLNLLKYVGGHPKRFGDPCAHCHPAPKSMRHRHTAKQCKSCPSKKKRKKRKKESEPNPKSSTVARCVGVVVRFLSAKVPSQKATRPRALHDH
jgi:hypothetical protein